MATTGEYNPFTERNVRHPTTDLDTFIHLLKGEFGAGILVMPYAFKHMGLWGGIPASIIVGSACAYCIHMLVKASQTLCFRCHIPSLTYAECAKQAFQNDPKELRKCGIAMSCIVNFFLILGLMACVCIYIMNIGRNLQQIMDLHAPGNSITLRYWILIVSVPIIFLCLIRELKYLVPFSMLGNLCMFTGLMITLGFIFTDLPKPNERAAIKPIRQWPSFFGTAIFALECIGIVLPCENKMKTPKHFTGCPSVLVYAMLVVITGFTAMGFFGYFKYGEATEANIVLNLPVENIWCQLVKVLIVIAIYCTCLLQFYVPINIILNSVRRKFPKNYENLCENSIRIASIIICTLITFTFPDLGPFITLIGAIGWTMLGLILPTILDIVVFRNDPGYGWLNIYLIKDIFLLIFGIIGLVSGTIESIREFNVQFKVNLNLGY